MLDQVQKLKEAEFFYDQMVDSFQKEMLDPFTFFLSAFLSATRSILQYTYEQAKSQKRTQEYDNLIARHSNLKYFKEKRDVNIHATPVIPIQQVRMDVHFSFTVRVSESVRIRVIESDGHISRDEKHESTGPIHEEIPYPLPEPTRTLHYRFEDSKDDDDVLEQSKQYLQNLRIFIQDAHAIGLI